MNPETIFQQALQALEDYDLEAAARYYEILRKLCPQEPDIWHLSGVVAWQQESHQQAASFFQHAIQLANEPHYHNNLGNALQGLGQFDEAIVAYETAIALQPEYAQAYTNLGLALQKKHQYHKALQAHQHAILFDPNSASAHYNLSHCLLAMEEAQQAENHLLQHFHLCAQDPESIILLGQTIQHQQRYHEARAHFVKALSLQPQNPQPLTHIAMSYIEEGNFKAALLRLEGALKLDPIHRDSLMLMGYTLSQLHQPVEAAECYHKILQFDTGDFEAWKGLGDNLNRQSRTSDALSCYHRALKIAPHFTEAWVQVGSTHLEFGNQEDHQESLQAAIHAFTKALELDPENGTALVALALLNEQEIAALPPSHIESLFDSYAYRFDDHLLETLEYQTPKLLSQFLDETLPNKPFQCAVDLGCGTGLLGQLIAHRCQRLEGVDLSTRMLDKAKMKGCYQVLHHGDIVQFLEQRKSFDLITAADVLVYCGDLIPFFEAAAHSLQPMGHLMISTENLAADQAFQINTKGRFAHNPKHLIQNAQQAGLQLVSKRRINLRKESMKWVTGDVFLFVNNPAG